MSGEEFSHAIVPLADGWHLLEVKRGEEVLFSGRLADKAHAERVAAHYVGALRGNKTAAPRRFNEDMRMSKPRNERRA